MHSKNNIFKSATLILADFFLFSFTTTYVLSSKDWKKIGKNAKTRTARMPIAVITIKIIKLKDMTSLKPLFFIIL